MNEKLYVIAVISNPVRYKSRYDLYHKFEKHVKDAGAILYTVEQAFGDRPFEVTKSDNPCHIQVRTYHELWHKENMINIGISRLPSDWEYMAFIDADIQFSRPDWVIETIHLLQHYMFIQMFSVAIDLGPNGEPIDHHTGFVYSYMNSRYASSEYNKAHQLSTRSKPWHKKSDQYMDDGLHTYHPGFCWAVRREAIDHVGGLIDWAILGSADRHMACAMIGQVEKSFYPKLRERNPRYVQKLLEWQARCEKYILRDIGYMPGTILHYWHGKKKQRGYTDRWKIITDNKFDPDYDVKRDSQGLWQLTDRNIQLRDDLRAYFRSRNEDSIDL